MESNASSTRVVEVSNASVVDVLNAECATANTGLVLSNNKNVSNLEENDNLASLGAKIRIIESQMLEGKLVLLGDDEKQLKLGMNKVMGHLSYACALIDIRADQKLKESMVIDIPNLEGNGDVLHTVRVEFGGLDMVPWFLIKRWNPPPDNHEVEAKEDGLANPFESPVIAKVSPIQDLAKTLCFLPFQETRQFLAYTAYPVTNLLVAEMDNPDIIMEEYIQLEAEKACRRGQEFNWETATYGKVRYFEDINYFKIFKNEFPAIVYKDALTSKPEVSSEPTVSALHVKMVDFDFEISFDEPDDEDYTFTYDKNSFSYKLISVNDLKLDSSNDDDKLDIK
ncbi:hypothetical protein Tco_0699599 [Tanacetum coccineum]